jgi:broad specificity phosphatase PhoE
MQRILLIRHGECDMNLHLAEKVGGRSNSSPLTLLGRKQSAALGCALQSALNRYNTPATSLMYFSSTAVRAIDTARAVMSGLGLEMGFPVSIIPPSNSKDETLNGTYSLAPGVLHVTEELLEIDMGDWEGALRSTCYTAETLALIADDCLNFAAPGGESQKQVEQRVMRFLREVVLPVTPVGGVSLVFGHGLAFKTVLRHIFDSDARMTRKIQLQNTGIIDIGYVDEKLRDSAELQPGWHVLRVNDTSHFRFIDDDQISNYRDETR